jgi:hypothetical protein
LYCVTGVLMITGGRLPFSCCTPIVYVCVAVPPRPSSTCSVTALAPSWSAAGFQVTSPLAGSMASPLGPDTTENVSVSPVGSVGFSERWFASLCVTGLPDQTARRDLVKFLTAVDNRPLSTWERQVLPMARLQLEPDRN